MYFIVLFFKQHNSKRITFVFPLCFIIKNKEMLIDIAYYSMRNNRINGKLHIMTIFKITHCKDKGLHLPNICHECEKFVPKTNLKFWLWKMTHLSRYNVWKSKIFGKENFENNNLWKYNCGFARSSDKYKSLRKLFS